MIFNKRKYSEKLKLIKYILTQEVDFFNDMFELAESEGILVKCGCGTYHIPPEDHDIEDGFICDECEAGDAYEESRQLDYRGR